MFPICALSFALFSYARSWRLTVPFLQNLNELRTLVADLVGEVPLEGFAEWRDTYDRSRALV